MKALDMKLYVVSLDHQEWPYLTWFFGSLFLAHKAMGFLWHFTHTLFLLTLFVRPPILARPPHPAGLLPPPA